MMLLKNRKIIIIILILITLQYINYKLEETVFAETTKTITIKVSLLFKADIDSSGRVDGKDLALLMFFFGKTESEYKSNSFNINPDINGDKIVDGEDLVILASHFGLEK
ncbi:MAG: hypothetical protein AB1498_10245 [bacterium]